MSYLCPNCECEGVKQYRRRICTDCFKIEVSEKNRRYNIRVGRIDPDRPVGRPRKSTTAWNTKFAAMQLSAPLLRPSL